MVAVDPENFRFPEELAEESAAVAAIVPVTGLRDEPEKAVVEFSDVTALEPENISFAVMLVDESAVVTAIVPVVPPLETSTVGA